MSRALTCFAIIFLSLVCRGQTKKSQQKTVSLSGYAEVYYGFDFNRPASNERPSFVYTHNRHNEVNVNLAMLSAGYATERVRANVALAAGTYMNAVYAPEPGVLKSLYEVNIGVKLSKRHSLWIDAGILPSHIGFESALSADCATLTRSMIADNSPYYESGARLSFSSPKERWYVAAFVLNGWQHIQRPAGNTLPAAGSQVTYQPSKKVKLNYSTFFGNDYPDSMKQYRLFHNVYSIVQVAKKVSVTAGIDYGMEQQAKASAKWNRWLGSCIIVQYRASERWALAARGEYYRDDSSMIVSTGLPGGFRTFGFSGNFDYYIADNVLWRVEGKMYVSQAAIYTDADGNKVATSPAATTSLCVRF